MLVCYFYLLFIEIWLFEIRPLSIMLFLSATISVMSSPKSEAFGIELSLDICKWRSILFSKRKKDGRAWEGKGKNNGTT